jgi:site-specific DNA recombinase
VRSKTRHGVAAGQLRGGGVLARGALYLIPWNRLYRGEIAHQGKAYPGDHQQIVDADLFQAVQARLDASRVERMDGAERPTPACWRGSSSTRIIRGCRRPMR